MKHLKDKPNAQPVSVLNPYGYIKDDPGDETGTYVDEEMYGDIHILIERMFDKSGLVANGLPDNSTNGFQLFEAFRKMTKKIFTFYTLDNVTLPVLSSYHNPVVISPGGAIITSDQLLILPDSTQATEEAGGYVEFQNNSDYLLQFSPDGTDTLEGSVSLMEFAPGDKGAFLLDKPNGNWILIRYDSHKTTNVEPVIATNLNSWINQMEYRRTKDGCVYLRGLPSNTKSAGNNNPIFQLPVGFRPATQKVFYRDFSNATANAQQQGIISVATNGNVTWSTSAGSAGDLVVLSLDDISFYINW